jgi:hypothetical protein
MPSFKKHRNATAAKVYSGPTCSKAWLLAGVSDAVPLLCLLADAVLFRCIHNAMADNAHLLKGLVVTDVAAAAALRDALRLPHSLNTNCSSSSSSTCGRLTNRDASIVSLVSM